MKLSWQAFLRRRRKKRFEVQEEQSPQPPPPAVREIGGPSGAEPTRYGDWERKGRCIDF